MGFAMLAIKVVCDRKWVRTISGWTFQDSLQWEEWVKRWSRMRRTDFHLWLFMGHESDVQLRFWPSRRRPQRMRTPDRWSFVLHGRRMSLFFHASGIGMPFCLLWAWSRAVTLQLSNYFNKHLRIEVVMVVHAVHFTYHSSGVAVVKVCSSPVESNNERRSCSSLRRIVFYLQR